MMGQLLLPLYSTDYLLITSHLGVQQKGETVYYFHCGVPIYSHGINEFYKFRYCTSNLILQGLCRNVDIVRIFKVSTDSVRRWKKVLDEKGEQAFFGSKAQIRRSSKLVPSVLAEIQQKLDKGQSVNSIARGLSISEGTIRSAIKKGRLKKKTNEEPAKSSQSIKASQPSERSNEDAQCANTLGIATTHEQQRIEAMLGQSEYVETDFGSHKSVLHAGVLLAIPALLAQGLNKAFTTYSPLKAGYYGLHHVIILSCLMALLRIKNVENLKGYPPGELGKILGLDRVPEVGHLRKKFHQIFKQEKTDQFHQALFSHWVDQMPEYYFYIDGHVRVYSGKKANLSKHFVSRQKLCLTATTEFWVNTEDGAPLMVLTGQLNEKLKEGVNQILPSIKNQVPNPTDTSTPRFTIVLDRESYEPAWYKNLWDQHQVAVITYRKNVKDKWAESQFQLTESQLYNNNVTMQICEMGSLIGGCWFTEVRVLSKNGHQTSIITTNHQIDRIKVATKMFTRWKQENFFKYMIANFDFDKMIEYGTETVDPKIEVVNPMYRKLSYQIKKNREKKTRRQARVYEKMQQYSNETVDWVEQAIGQTSDLIDEVITYDEQITELKKDRKQVPARIKVEEMEAEVRYDRLKTESKKYKNTILMLAYRAETAIYNSLPTTFRNAKKEGRALLREIFKSQADIEADHKSKILRIKIHSLSTPRNNEALKHICSLINETKTIYPKTNLQMVFETIAS